MSDNTKKWSELFDKSFKFQRIYGGHSIRISPRNFRPSEMDKITLKIITEEGEILEFPGNEIKNYGVWVIECKKIPNPKKLIIEWDL